MWEYQVLAIPEIPERAYTATRPDVEAAFLDAQGQAGWELVAVQGGYFYFKRRLPVEHRKAGDPL